MEDPKGAEESAAQEQDAIMANDRPVDSAQTPRDTALAPQAGTQLSTEHRPQSLEEDRQDAQARLARFVRGHSEMPWNQRHSIAPSLRQPEDGLAHRQAQLETSADEPLTQNAEPSTSFSTDSDEYSSSEAWNSEREGYDTDDLLHERLLDEDEYSVVYSGDYKDEDFTSYDGSSGSIGSIGSRSRSTQVQVSFIVPPDPRASPLHLTTQSNPLDKDGPRVDFLGYDEDPRADLVSQIVHLNSFVDKSQWQDDSKRPIVIQVSGGQQSGAPAVVWGGLRLWDPARPGPSTQKRSDLFSTNEMARTPAAHPRSLERGHLLQVQPHPPRPHGKSKAADGAPSPRPRVTRLWHDFAPAVVSMILAHLIDSTCFDTSQRRPRSTMIKDEQLMHAKYGPKWVFIRLLAQTKRLRLVNRNWNRAFAAAKDWYNEFLDLLELRGRAEGTPEERLSLMSWSLRSSCMVCLLNDMDGDRNFFRDRRGSQRHHMFSHHFYKVQLCSLHGEGAMNRKAGERVPICHVCLMNEPRGRRGDLLNIKTTRGEPDEGNGDEIAEMEAVRRGSTMTVCQTCRAEIFDESARYRLSGYGHMAHVLLAKMGQTHAYLAYVMVGVGDLQDVVEDAIAEVEDADRQELQDQCDCRICQRQKRKRDDEEEEEEEEGDEQPTFERKRPRLTASLPSKARQGGGAYRQGGGVYIA
ncbi:unnamed protein product [Parajaminaea phylloscopi]